MDIMEWHELPEVPTECIQVLMELQFEGDSFVTSDGDVAPLVGRIDALPPHQERKQSKSGQPHLDPKVVVSVMQY